MPIKPPRLVVAVMIALVSLGCASVEEKIPIVGAKYRERDEGFSLLYDLAAKQQDVDKVLIIKHADTRVADEIKGIAQTFRQAHERLDAFAKQDSSLNFKINHLPVVETKTRDSVQSTTTKDLLFSSGKDFELRLLLTQVQALNYATHLARVLADRESDGPMKSFLADFSKQCQEHLKNVVSLLTLR